MTSASGVSTEQLRALALALPGTVERRTWGHPTFRLHERIVVGMDEDAGTATIRATREAQAALVAIAPETYDVAPRVGRHGWVRVQLATADLRELRQLVLEARHLAARSTRGGR
ncbi:MmcQ/YjbR family DNA-binding protein [Quadrisphaera sp. DSM 44207]|uniref:MmcQ/YjbR family DNA-binding protein n=1 Tax=Quadrisphaera sp. DSM 44207 TaxID=1881057 RepID=UPI000883254C|nr:MmcQ/YjbR family DNA-binding protein [Quadrisphaera sp. DSM 44207]SDQ70579.1 hypothetical protein SAMN05428996_2476 [Quadrisphaera sp. DSM 44207]